MKKAIMLVLECFLTAVFFFAMVEVYNHFSPPKNTATQISQSNTSELELQEKISETEKLIFKSHLAYELITNRTLRDALRITSPSAIAEVERNEPALRKEIIDDKLDEGINGVSSKIQNSEERKRYDREISEIRKWIENTRKNPDSVRVR